MQMSRQTVIPLVGSVIVKMIISKSCLFALCMNSLIAFIFPQLPCKGMNRHQEQFNNDFL